LTIASKLIPDESYWQRRSQGRYKLCSIEEHNNSYKQFFFETYVRDIIESHVPKSSDDEAAVEEITNILKTAADYIEKLEIRQLRPTEPPELNPPQVIFDGATKELSKELIIKPNEPQPNHFDVSLLFNILFKLKDLSLFYG
jgi:hypothetical protein